MKKKNMEFLYTMKHPICNIVKFTNDPNIAESHSRSGWDVHCKGRFNKHDSYKHTSPQR